MALLTPLTDDHLAHLALGLENEQHRTGRWTSPPRLLALGPVEPGSLEAVLAAGSLAWRRLGEGNPYHLLDTVVVEADDTAALALLVHGWAFPPDDVDSWFGRPSEHPGRIRVRSVTIVTPDRRQCSAIRLQHREARVDSGGTGALMDAMLSVWDRPPRRAPGPVPARCRRDYRG